ncbi:hypothetical protein H9P43_009142 [Blastocladiella emersonii ATCC 22665]|nr:hypothetical protein H9P43_009142 [Blastocladiella emersonii ATCC 22665]
MSLETLDGKQPLTGFPRRWSAAAPATHGLELVSALARCTGFFEYVGQVFAQVTLVNEVDYLHDDLADNFPKRIEIAGVRRIEEPLDAGDDAHLVLPVQAITAREKG